MSYFGRLKLLGCAALLGLVGVQAASWPIKTVDLSDKGAACEKEKKVLLRTRASRRFANVLYIQRTTLIAPPCVDLVRVRTCGGRRLCWNGPPMHVVCAYINNVAEQIDQHASRQHYASYFADADVQSWVAALALTRLFRAAQDEAIVFDTQKRGGALPSFLSSRLDLMLRLRYR